ncbi:unnamed protein product [Symbiodinium sp. CCMP2592]|nr:unnamed protein product [Symbiodinium sp. CCMP2592]
MPFEAIFMISKHERQTDQSDGPHLSAGTAACSGAFDFAGGTTDNHRVPMLFPELLRLLPAYYFCPNYLSTLAACSRDVKTEVMNRNHWIGCHLDLETPEFLRDQETLMAMSKWWRNARTVNLSQHQLAWLDEIPQNCMLRWKVFDLPVHDECFSGYRATHSLLGCARFRISVPDNVRALRFGIENPRGPEAVYMSIHELFTERMCFSLGLVPLQRARGSRRVPLAREVLRCRAPNDVMLMWDRRYFAVNLNGFNFGPVRLELDALHGPPSQAVPVVWARRAQRNRDVTPLLSPVMPAAECCCRICQLSHVLEHHSCAVCPVCSAWVCRDHVELEPQAQCPGCPSSLADFLGGSVNYTHPCDEEHIRLAVAVPTEPGPRDGFHTHNCDALLVGMYRRLTDNILNNILQMYNCALQGPPVSEPTSRACLGHRSIRGTIVAFCTTELPDDIFWAESIAHSLNNCCTFTSNSIIWHPRPLRPIHDEFIDHDRPDGYVIDDADEDMDVADLTGEGSTLLGGWPAALENVAGSVLREAPRHPVFDVPENTGTESVEHLRPCLDLANINKCDRDALLRFEAEGHRYFYKDVSVSCSVTTLIHQYAEEFDPAVALQKMKNGRRWPRPEYMDPEANLVAISKMLAGLDFRLQADIVALLTEVNPDRSKICELVAESKSDMEEWEEFTAQLMLHDNEILDLWDRRRNEAANSGTWMHAMLERLLNGYMIRANRMQGELNAAICILSQMESVEVYRTEWCIYAVDEDVAGSIDLVLKEKDEDIYYLVDWKRSEKLRDNYNSFGRAMKPPLHEVPDCQGYHYRLQLNIYKWILEKYYGIKVRDMKVICIHPRYLPDGFVDDVPDMQAEVSQLMQSRRDSLLAHNMQHEMELNSVDVGPGDATDSAPAVRPSQEARQNMEQQPSLSLPGASQAARLDTQDDLEKDLENLMMENLSDDEPHASKKRRLLPGAAEHSVNCKKMFARCHEILADALDSYSADVCVKRHTILGNTRAMLSELRREFPNLSAQVCRLILVAAHLAEGKVSDKPMLPDSAALTWMVEGDRHLRVHKGFLYIYDDDGCFLPFSGIPPESVLQRVYSFFACLEGLFRRMRPEISRKGDSVARAITADLQSFENEDEFLQACRDATNLRQKTAAYPPRLDADETLEQHQDDKAAPQHDSADELWTMEMAEKAWKLSCNIRQELMHTRMISLLVEWCETEDQRSTAICYDDVCFMYDRPGSPHPIDAVKKGPHNNCYVRVPHPLMDPVMEANQERLQLFYEQTFWCNLDVIRCFQAAAAIAKRGYNVDRCFIGISPGGVGQSLYSLHLSEMYKQNHAFFDPNIWHLDEELRKQVESFARCFILTGQEAPETSKKMHIDLYKKTISGDGIMGRKPYGYSTSMFRMIGWTRLEMNRIMQFIGVRASSFHSMFRRSFVWKSKARFVQKKFLSKYPDHKKDGIFEADPSLSKFLSTSQASIAGLRLQWAFERDHTKDDCYQLIEDYCNGGDGFLTEDTMRNACGLPVRQRQIQEEDGLANVLEADAQSEEEREEKDVEWENLRSFLVEHMLASDLSHVTFYEFKKITFKPDKHPNLSKADMWDQMTQHDVVRPAIMKGKTSKEKPGAFIPLFKFKKQFADICHQDDHKTRMDFEEEHDLGLLKKYAFQSKGRLMNAENLKIYYQSMMPAARKGRRTLEQDEVLTKYQKIIQKLEDHEDSILAVLLPKKRRMTGKTSQEEQGFLHQDDQTEWQSSKSSKSVQYRYSDKQSYSIAARRYAEKGGAQSISRRLQVHVVDGHTTDLDISNCCLTLVQQILQKLEPQPALPEELAALLDDIVQRRTDFLSELDLHLVGGKELINTVFNGGSPPDELKGHSRIKKLQKLSLYVRWVACNILYSDYMSLQDSKQKEFPSATIMSLMWHSVEDAILHAWTEHVLAGPTKPRHLSLHFDGIRVSSDFISDMEDYIKGCQEAITKATSFNVTIVAKTHHCFSQLLQKRGTKANNLSNVPTELLQPGNCVPCGLWHIVPLSRQSIVAAIGNKDLPENANVGTTKYRSYRSMAQMCDVDLVACVGLPQPHVKSYMLHYEGTGSPHCVAVRLDASTKTATVLDGRSVYKLSIRLLAEICAAAVDTSTVVCYWKRDPQDKLDGKFAALLDMVAGAASEESESLEDDGPSGMPSKFSFDEDDNAFVSDGILTMLRQETKEVLEDPRKMSSRVDGRRLCPLCPFRSFAQLRQLRTHLEKHHVESNQYVCSGTKQIKVILALYDHAASSQLAACELLQRSAALMRSTVTPPLNHRINHVDKHIRLVLDAAGPRYVNLLTLRNDMELRRVRNIYYTHSYADLLLREAVLNHAQAGGLDRFVSLGDVSKRAS